MPYQGEYAHYQPLQRMAQNERVKELLHTYRIQSLEERSSEPLPVTDVQASEWAPKWILAVDGSYAPITVENGFPGAEVAYMTVASVLIDSAKVRELDATRPVNPKEFRTTEESGSIDWVLPGCNVVYEGEEPGKGSFRKSLYELFCSQRIAPDGESLLDTYESLLEYKPKDHSQRCPYEDCPAQADYSRACGRYTCSCALKRPVYSTDALRIHERMEPSGANGQIYAEILQVLERVWVIHILRMLVREHWLPALSRMAVVVDGPLAIFGQPAWLSQAISHELYRLNDLVRAATRGRDLLLIGIEKTGLFATHLQALDTQRNGKPGALDSRSVILINDKYIKHNITPSESSKPYGQDTYFGRKLFYKASTGALIVATLPFFSDMHKDMSTAEPSQFPRLADALSLLEQVISSRYENALAPLVSAHAEAAIPLHLGKKILERLAQDSMQDDQK